MSIKELNQELQLEEHYNFTYNSLKQLINKYGKTNKEIADDIIKFCKHKEKKYLGEGRTIGALSNIGLASTTDAYGKNHSVYSKERTEPEFYAYYADYDWVVFCWLFGKMIDLPKGFPMYCNDLKQELNRILNSLKSFELSKIVYPNCSHNVFEELDTGLLTDKIKCLKDSINYPIQKNTHNALEDARWNKELFNFLNTI